jgi:hypothetical protein
MRVHYLRSRGASPLFFNQYLWLKKGTEIIRALVGDAHLNRFDAFVSSRWIKIKAVTAGMQISPTILALIGYADLVVHNLDFRSAIIAARNQVELRLNSPAGALGTRGRLGLPFPFPIGIHIAWLTILSRHFLLGKKNGLGMEVTGYKSNSASKPNFQFLLSGELTIEFESTQEGLAPSRPSSSKLNPPQRA